MSDLAAALELFTRALDGDGGATAAFGERLVPRPPLTASRRLAIYRDSSRAARIRALEQVYPVCGAVLGERCLRTLAWDHVEAHPSRHPDLERFGEAFDQTLAAFLGERAGPAFSGMDYLPALARLEWLWHVIRDEADDPGFDGPAFLRDAGRAPSRVVLTPSRSLRLFASRWPVYGLWRRRGEPSGAPEEGAGGVVLWRRGLERRSTAVDAETFHLLRRMVTGADLEELAAASPRDVLSRWVAMGWVAGHAVREGDGRRAL